MPEGITEKKEGKIEELLDEMKNEGIVGALLRRDGVVVYSTVALSDVAPSLMARCFNISEAIMERMKNTQKEVEITLENTTIVLVPIKNFIFCGIAKSKDEKRRIIEYSKKVST